MAWQTVASPSLLALACASAGVGAGIACHVVLGMLARARRASRLKGALAIEVGAGSSPKMHAPLIASLARWATAHLQRRAQPCGGPAGRGRAKGTSEDAYALRIGRAGLDGEVSSDGFALARLVYAALAAAGVLLIGVAVAPGAALPASAASGLIAWASAPRGLNAMASRRSAQLEAHLSEAVEVVCLGLRGGMPFDRALGLYCSSFDTLLARELRLALGIWQAGIVSREAALRNLAESYDSAVLGRVVDSIVRSMRFGSPLADALDALASDARSAHRARVQERVMKAPVKMMVPIGALILPSMLLLVTGPVVLELAGGL